MIERIPPHNLEAETDLLAACLMAEEALPLAMALDLKASDFYRAAHGSLFAVMVKLFQRHEPVGFIGIRELGSAEDYTTALDVSARLATAAGVEYHARLVMDHAERRAAIRAHYETLESLYDPLAEDPVTAGLGRVMAVETRRGRSGPRDFFDTVETRVGNVHYLATLAQEDKPEGFTLGLPDLDRMANFEPADLMVIGARPSTGKTALVLQILTHVAARLPVLFFSLEMRADAIAGRFITHELGVSAYRQSTGYLSREEIGQLGNVSARASHLRLKIDDTAGLTAAEMRAIATREHMRLGGLGLIVVDHMLEVKAADPRATGHARLSQVYRDVKKMGRDLGARVIALHQLNRSGEDDEEPTMDRLRESGTIEEVADHILLLHRPERAGETNNAALIYAKQRNGPVGRIDLVFESKRTRFACVQTYGGA